MVVQVSKAFYMVDAPSKGEDLGLKHCDTTPLASYWIEPVDPRYVRDFLLLEILNTSSNGIVSACVVSVYLTGFSGSSF